MSDGTTTQNATSVGTATQTIASDGTATHETASVAADTAAANGHKAGATGTILQITGPVVDVQFPADKLPEIYNALEVTKDDGTVLTLETQSHLGNDAVR